MSASRGGGYWGNKYDPNYRNKRDSQQGYDSRPNYAQSPPTTSQSNMGGSYARNGYTTSQSKSQPSEYPHSQQSRFDGYDGHAPRTNQVNSAPTPNTMPISVPTGPASARSAPLPSKPLSYHTGSSMPTLEAHTTDRMPNGIPRTSAYVAEVQDSGKEDGEITSSISQSSPVSAKIHPSRLGIVPHINHNKADTPNGSSTTSSSATQSEGPASGRFSQGSWNSLQRNTRPAPLSFTPIVDSAKSAAHGLISSTPTPTSSQNQSQSSVAKSPLDSLEKLRRFKEQVAASRKPSNAYSGPELSQIALMAAKFLKSQDVDSSEKAFEALKQITSSSPEVDAKDKVREPTGRGNGVSIADGATTSKPVNPSDGASSRQTELKERLLALKSGRGLSARGSSHVPPTVGSNSTPASPAQPNGSVSGSVLGFKPPPSLDPREAAEDTEQKRFRAAAWQKAHDQERQEQQQRAEAAAAAAVVAGQSSRDPRTLGFENVRRADIGPSATSRGATPPRGPRDNGDGKHAHAFGPLQDRLGDRQPHGYASRDRFGTRVQREPESPANSRYGARMSRDDSRRDSRSKSPDRRYAQTRPSNDYARRDLPGSRYRDRSPVGGDTGPLDKPRAPRYSHPADPVDSMRLAKQESISRPESEHNRYARVPPPNHSRAPRYSQEQDLRSPPPGTSHHDHPRDSASGRIPPPAHALAPAPPMREDYRRPQDLPLPPPIAARVQPLPMMVDPATVHATLDILKAQIARLEALVPAMVPSQPVYSYDPYHIAAGLPFQASLAAAPTPVPGSSLVPSAMSASVPSPLAPGYRLEWDERQRQYAYVYDPSRAESSHPPHSLVTPGPRDYYDSNPHPSHPSPRPLPGPNVSKRPRPRTLSPPPLPPRTPSVAYSTRDLQNRIGTEPTRRPRAPSSSYSRGEYKKPYQHPPKDKGYRAHGEGRGGGPGRGRGGGAGRGGYSRGGRGGERNARGGYR